MLPSLENMSLSVARFAKNPVRPTDGLIDDLVDGKLELFDHVLHMATRPGPNEGPNAETRRMRALVASLSAVALGLRNIGLWQLVAKRLEIPGAAKWTNATTDDFTRNRRAVLLWCRLRETNRTIASATFAAVTALEKKSPEGDDAALWLINHGADVRVVLPNACYYGREAGFGAIMQALGGIGNVDLDTRHRAVIMAFEGGNQPMAHTAIKALALVYPQTLEESIKKAALHASKPLLQLLVPLTPSGVADDFFLQNALEGAVLAGALAVAAIATVVALGAQLPSSQALAKAGMAAIKGHRPVALRALDNTAGGFVANDLINLFESAGKHALRLVIERYPVLVIETNPLAPPLEFLRHAMACLNVLLSAHVPPNEEMVSAALPLESSVSEETGLISSKWQYTPFLLLHFFDTVKALQPTVPLVYNRNARERAMFKLFTTIRPGAAFLDALFRCVREFLYPPGGERLSQHIIEILFFHHGNPNAPNVATYIFWGVVENKPMLVDVPTLLRLINALYSRADLDQPLTQGLSVEKELRRIHYMLDYDAHHPGHSFLALQTTLGRAYRDLFPLHTRGEVYPGLSSLLPKDWAPNFSV